MRHPTYLQCARSWELWCDYVDPSGAMTREEFDALSVEQRIEIERECFGEETSECDRCRLDFVAERSIEADEAAICPACEEG